MDTYTLTRAAIAVVATLAATTSASPQAGNVCEVADVLCPTPRCYPPHTSCTQLSTQLVWTHSGKCCEEMCVWTDCDFTIGGPIRQPEAYDVEEEYEEYEEEEAKKKKTTTTQAPKTVTPPPKTVTPPPDKVAAADSAGDNNDNNDNNDDALCSASNPCCDADAYCMLPRGGTAKRCVGATDRVGSTKAQGCDGGGGGGGGSQPTTTPGPTTMPITTTLPFDPVCGGSLGNLCPPETPTCVNFECTAAAPTAPPASEVCTDRTSCAAMFDWCGSDGLSCNCQDGECVSRSTAPSFTSEAPTTLPTAGGAGDDDADNDDALCSASNPCCDADAYCMLPRGGTAKRCVGSTDVVGSTKAQGCDADGGGGGGGGGQPPAITTTTAATAAATTTGGCADDPSICGKGMFCLTCSEFVSTAMSSTSECMPRVLKGGACSSGYGSMQCTGFQCRYGYKCQDYSTPSAAPFAIADHPDVCCPKQGRVKCNGDGKQVVDVTGCLTSACDNDGDGDGGGDGGDSTTAAAATANPLKTKGVRPTAPPTTLAPQQPQPNHAAGLAVGAVCYVADAFCPVASCSVPQEYGRSCIEIDGEKTVRDMSMAGMGNMCCPKLCVFDCSTSRFGVDGAGGAGASTGNGGGGDGSTSNGMSGGTTAIVVIVVLILIGVVGFGVYLTFVKDKKMRQQMQMQLQLGFSPGGGGGDGKMILGLDDGGSMYGKGNGQGQGLPVDTFQPYPRAISEGQHQQQQQQPPRYEMDAGGVHGNGGGGGGVQMQYAEPPRTQQLRFGSNQNNGGGVHFASAQRSTSPAEQYSVV